ncbi:MULTISPECIES: MFS transporter [unclassified Pseudomonas]|uniref:MFS transporter n=1 Tax=unclassified Pseudomonas TaxID=196821 RepID=UPI000BCB5F45|nr:MULTISPECIES: MFS transporter [unclassified Pseudomonas]PVZ15416.1 fucose permease [Pseudomonas sp. URIL14HWK12:I12]PVZ24790.1 fucose permease [Pseudomonas sp. URIL14HWK12:I10]PVZ34636.1 fucose permease [Pseudomonas sp. URIL14HWK12:I11]SNZ08831.1 Fucose permease [Pseudomonas sp. URIL14HWK12:I9]
MAGPAVSNLRQQQATRAVFFVAGLAMAAWAPLIPYAKARLGIDEGTLGLLLFCIAAGSMLAMPMAGRAIARFGCRVLILACAGAFCGVLPLMMLARTPLEMGAALLLFGAANGLLDVTMNAQAVIVERESGQARMSGFHGFYSLGSVAGAGGVSLMLAAGAGQLLAVGGVVALIALLTLPARSGLLSVRPSDSSGPGGAWRALAQPGLLFIAGLCFFIFMIEGAMLDWSAVLLHSQHGLAKDHAGLGYTLYAITVALARLWGDRLVNRLGRPRALGLGAGCAAAGLLAVVSFAEPGLALAGFALVGLGLANIVPVLFSSAGNHAGVPSSTALAAVTLVGYTGLLSGPALIGVVARHTGLPAAFSAGVVILLLVCASSRFIPFHRTQAMELS